MSVVRVRVGEPNIEKALKTRGLFCAAELLVHEGGFRIERDYQNRWFFKRPDGRAVPSCGYQAQDMIDDDIDQYIDNRTGELSRSINNPSAEGFLTALKTSSVMSPRP